MTLSKSRDDELEQAIALAMRWKDDHGPDQPHKSLGLLARALLDSRAALVMAEARVMQSEKPRSLSDFVHASPAEREAIGAEVVAKAIERQNASIDKNDERRTPRAWVWRQREGGSEFIMNLPPASPKEKEKYDGTALFFGDESAPAKLDIKALVNRFLAWPLPESVCSDMCATKQGYPSRVGTNLLTAVEARQMLEHVLAGLIPSAGGNSAFPLKLSDAGARGLIEQAEVVIKSRGFKDEVGTLLRRLAEQLQARLMPSHHVAPIKARELGDNRWEWPVDTVGQLIVNLQTLPPQMPMWTAYFVEIDGVNVAKVIHPSISRETVDRLRRRIDKFDPEAQSLVIWAHQDERAIQSATRDTERMDFMERHLCRAGEVKNDAGQTVKLARVWSIMGELETLRETVDALMAATESRKTGGEHG